MQDQQHRTGLGWLSQLWTDWIATFGIMILLLLTLVIGTGEMIHGQMLRIGERIYGDPDTGMQYSFLRAEPQKPSCNANPDIEAQVKTQMQANAADEFAAFFGTASEADVRASLLAAKQECVEKNAFYDKALAHIEAHPSVRTYRTVETGFFALFKYGSENRALLLVLMVVIAAISTTLKMHHIGIRSPLSKVDYVVYGLYMTLGNLLMTTSSISQYYSVNNAGVEVPTDTNMIYWLWMGLFGLLTAISAYGLFNIPKNARPGGSIGLSFLSVPLYAHMAILTGIAFTFFMDYPMGQGIYLGQLVEFSNIFLNLALFVWAGMLLKQTRIVDLFLNILRPWNLAPETLTWLIMLAAALPTAYTGASGIFVIAAGAIIYKEVWNAGGRRQYAIAAAAMSGSMGVVLRPCLLIVVVASLNKEVTTDLLYHFGSYVFLLTSTLFLIVSLYFAETKFRIAPAKIALPKSLNAFVAVSPYIVIFLLTWMFYKFALDTSLNEFTAPVMMPVILLMMVLFDKLRDEPAPIPAVGHWDSSLNVHHAKTGTVAEVKINPEDDPTRPERHTSFGKALRFATNETVGHIGALIILMALSVSVGGFLERIEIMELFPTNIESTVLVITLIVALMIFVGMIMDPFGAVILISATVAPVAYKYGIDPVHFWMITLIGFELGYVSPPVALNQLLARQSIGDAEVNEADAEVKHKSFFWRYERWIFPLLVMVPAMLIIAYVPYFFNLFGWYS